MNSNPQLESFYNGGELCLDAYTLHAGRMASSVQTVGYPQSLRALQQGKVDTKIREIDRTLGYYESNGRYIEAGSANTTQLGLGTVLRPLTYRTHGAGPDGNPGNDAEVGLDAARDPQHGYYFVALPGNGGSSPLLPEDAEYFYRTGRLTPPSGSRHKALQSVLCLTDTLERVKAVVTKIDADSGGCRLGLGSGPDLPKGQVESCFFTGAPGRHNSKRLTLAARMVVKAHIINSLRNSQNDMDPWKLTPERKQKAREIMTRNFGETPLPPGPVVNRGLPRIKRLWKVAGAFAMGPSQGFPLAHDIRQFREAQPDARLTFLWGSEDEQYTNQSDLVPGVHNFLEHSHVKGAAPLTVLILPGMSHTFYIDHPSVRAAIRDRALSVV